MAARICTRHLTIGLLAASLGVTGAGCRSGETAERSDATVQIARPSVADEELRQSLLDLQERDQAARAELLKVMQSAEPLPGGGVKLTDDARDIVLAVRAIDMESTAFLKSMVDSRGWPRVSEVGEDGAHAAWLLVQHADAEPEFQARVLALMGPLVAEGEASAADFALLTDRVRLARGETQVYGTQFATDENGTLRPRPTEDWANVDTRRAEVGLPPMEVYVQTMEESYGGKVELVPMPQ